MTTLLITHPCFVDHDTGHGHPERADRMRAVDKVLAHDLFADLKRVEAPLPADLKEAILRVHPADYLGVIQSKRPEGDDEPVWLEINTVMSPGTWEAITRAVGAGMLAVDRVMSGEGGVKNAFCQVRPPGHHAETSQAMGFCIFNSIAIAAHHARAVHGVERVAVVDFDVHHGNGTQDIFWSDKNFFFGSTHQMPLYPGTGAVGETGVGNIWNAPLRPNDGGEAFRSAFESRILPALHNFSPDLLLISAGFDAHINDPLANLNLVEQDFLWVTEALLEAANQHCKGRVVSMLEGGYDLAGLARSAGVHVKALMDA